MIRRGEKANLLWNRIRVSIQRREKLKKLPRFRAYFSWLIRKKNETSSEQEKERERAGEKREKFLFVCQKIKMKEKRNDSITRQISLNKQFVLPSSSMFQKKWKGMKLSRDKERKKAKARRKRSTNRSCVITRWCLDYDGTFCSTFPL